MLGSRRDGEGCCNASRWNALVAGFGLVQLLPSRCLIVAASVQNPHKFHLNRN